MTPRTLPTGIYLVTDSLQCIARDLVGTVLDAVNAGVRTVQIREKTATAAEFLELVVRVAAAVEGNATLLIDDQVGVYLAARAAGAQVHGVHIGQSDLSATLVRRMVGESAIVGLTANSPKHLQAVHALPHGTVDYLGVGVIRATSTKPDHPAPLGIEGFAEFVADTDIPCVAIGGIHFGDIAALRARGAHGAAVVSEICAAPDPRHAAARLVEEWDTGAVKGFR
ncbi:MAG: thiamine phosphate synthase [Actinomycetota bacterium]|jgi:thiamine-phosphate diphosphorylase|nr:thiamine phosphate synthase [Actinomycetota bacterium]